METSTKSLDGVSGSSVTCLTSVPQRVCLGIQVALTNAGIMRWSVTPVPIIPLAFELSSETSSFPSPEGPTFFQPTLVQNLPDPLLRCFHVLISLRTSKQNHSNNDMTFLNTFELKWQQLVAKLQEYWEGISNARSTQGCWVTKTFTAITNFMDGF